MSNFRTLTIDNFGKGFSDSDYEATLGQFKYAQDFNIYDDDRVLTPATGLSAYGYGLASVSSQVRDFESYGTNLYAIGKNSGSTDNVLLMLTGVAANWMTAGVLTAGVGTGGLELYNDHLYFYTDDNIIGRYNAMSSYTGNLTADFQTTGLSSLAGTPYAHASSDEIYFAAQNSVHAYDGTTFTTSAMTVPNNYEIIGFAPWNRWVVIGANSKFNSETSKLFLWDSYNMYPEQIVDIGDKYLKQIANIGGTIVCVCAPSDINFYEWRGGSEVYLGKTLKTGNPSNEGLTVGNYDVKNGRMYVPIGGATTFTQGIYTYEPHLTNPKLGILNLDRVPGNVATNSALTMNAVGWFDSGETDATARMFASYGVATNNFNIERTTTNYSNSAQWQSIIYEPFPAQQSQINRLTLYTKPLPASTALSAFTKTDMGSWGYVGAITETNAIYKDFYDANGYAFNYGNYHQFRIDAGVNGTTKPELLKLIVKFKDAERR